MPVCDVVRIAAPSRKVFREEYLDAQRPVIIQGLFAGQPIDEIRSEQDAEEQLGSIAIPISNEYLASLEEQNENGSGPGREMMPLSAYLDHARRFPGTRKMCSEVPTPREIVERFQLPAYDVYYDAISSFFVGNEGNFAHMHFDGDYRHVLFHQVFGTKRFLLIEPSEGQKINATGNNASWSIENFPEADKLAFANFTNAYDCLLYPGETLFMPACIWHYVEYKTTCMSFNLRFGRNRYTRYLSSHFPMEPLVQNIAWAFSNEQRAKAQYDGLFQKIVEADEREYENASAKMAAIDALFQRIVAEVNPRWPAKPYVAPVSGKIQELYRTAAERLYSRKAVAKA